jgi:hypothetical protein
LKPSSLNSAKSVYGYQINSFFDSIPLIKEIYNLANQALLFAPSDKHQEIKDAAYSGLKPYKSVCDDTKDKIEKYFRLEGVYITHRDETKKIIAVLQGDLAVMNMKKKRYLGGTVVSLAAFVLGLFWATMNLAFVIFSLAGLISLIVFLIKYIIQGSKIMILNRQIDDLSRVLKNLKSANGHSDWPDYQGRPEMIQEALNLFYSNLNRYSQT